MMLQPLINTGHGAAPSRIHLRVLSLGAGV